MSYTPTNWTTGDTITATKLNKLENGVANAGSALIVQCSNNTLDKTVQEIYDAMSSGTPVYIKWAYGSITNTQSDYVACQWLCPVTMVYRYSTTAYRVAATRGDNNNNDYDSMGSQTVTFGASSMSGYPVFLGARN